VSEYPRQGSGTPSFTREKPHLPEGGDAHFLLDPRRDGTPPTEVSLSDLAGSLSRLTPEQLDAFVAFAQAMRKGGAR
jgi:hypothetical protein